MHDYSAVGRAKLEMQVQRNDQEIRCPLDGAMMLVTRSVAAKKGEVNCREFAGRPRSSDWSLQVVDLVCSACRRSAHSISVHASDAAVEQVSQRTRPQRGPTLSLFG